MFRERLVRRPASVRFEEVVRLLNLYGWTFQRSRGSHFAFRRGRETITVPFRRPHVLAVYVKLVLERTQEQTDE